MSFRSNCGIFGLSFQHFDWEETRVPRENPRLTNSSFTCVHIARIEPTEVKGVCSDDYATILMTIRHHWLPEVLLIRLLLPLSRQTSDLLLYCTTAESTFLSIYRKNKYIEPFSLSLSVPNLQKNI
jgi:hypothetical protein